MIFALGAPHRGQMRPDPDRFAIAGSPYVPLDSPKAMKVTRFVHACAIFSLLSIGFAAVQAQPQRPEALDGRRPGRTVIAVGRILDGRGGVKAATRIVVEGSKIATIDAKAGPVDYDLSRATLMPG